jgi:hypothetical protein
LGLDFRRPRAARIRLSGKHVRIRPDAGQKGETFEEKEMPEHTNDPRPPVPDLIERYRLRRDAWIAQADELARLRDEVRSAAEREAMEIVTAARRDVRQVIMEARRELLVLSAQVQAALGEVSAKEPPPLNRGSDPPALQSGATIEHSSSLLVPEAAVKTMLDEARADIEALAEDAKTVPFHATSLAPQPIPVAEEERSAPPPAPPPSAPLVFESMASLAPPPTSSSTSPAASRVLLSSPFPIDAVAVPASRSVRRVVGLFVLAGIAVVGTSIWWLTSRDSSSETAKAKPGPAAPAAPAAGRAGATAAARSTSRATETAAPAAPVVAAKEVTPGRLLLTVEARRQSWIRTTVDGESDIGRMYKAGEKLQLNAQRGISLRVGDAGAVYVSVNKGTATRLGGDGQVITRQFVVDRSSSSSAVGSPATIAPSDAPPALSKPVPPSVPTASLTPGTSPPPLVQPTVTRTNQPPLEAATPTPGAPTPPAPPAATPPSASANVPQPPTTTAVVAAARQWLDAYQKQERSVMAALSTDSLQLADERRADERFPPNAEVSRSLDRISVQIAADTAVLTAVMTERDAATQRVSPISQVWVLSGGQWRVRQVRLVSEARLNQIFR